MPHWFEYYRETFFYYSHYGCVSTMLFLLFSKDLDLQLQCFQLLPNLALILALQGNLRLNTAHPTRVRIRIAKPCIGSVMTPRMTMKLLKTQKTTGLKVGVL